MADRSEQVLLDEKMKKAIAVEAARVARQEVLQDRWRRWMTEAVLVIAVMGGLFAYQTSRDDDIEELARGLAAQNEVVRYEQDRVFVDLERDACSRINEGLRDPIYFILTQQAENSRDTSGEMFMMSISMMVDAVEDAPAGAPKELREILPPGSDDLYRTDCEAAFPYPERPPKAAYDLAESAEIPISP